MFFDWSSAKAVLNLKKHGISFEEAASAFYDPLSATFLDDDHSISEQRFLTIDFSEVGRLLVVAHTDQGDVIRIISARRATTNERKRHAGQH